MQILTALRQAERQPHREDVATARASTVEPKRCLASAAPACVAQFMAELAQVGGQCIAVADRSALMPTIEGLVTNGQSLLSLCHEVAGNRQFQSAPEALHDIDWAVCHAQLGIAESGAILLDDRQCGQRVLPIIAEQLIVVLEQRQIVATMSQAVEFWLQANPELDWGWGSFLVGPSSSHAIDDQWIRGAQGGCSLTVLLLP
ncbi:MAG: LUD domain-containing protein [Ferrimonas sp.]